MVIQIKQMYDDILEEKIKKAKEKRNLKAVFILEIELNKWRGYKC